MERISPVRVFMTMAIPLLACDAVISEPRACSVTYWSGSSMVSSMPVPALEEDNCVVLPGSVTPLGDCSIVSVPFSPPRRPLYWYSSPDKPVPSAPTSPMTGAAT